MAVTFTSGFYDGPTTETLRAETWMGPTYGVRTPGSWRVSGVAGADRTVSIAAGLGFGHGVTDKTVANDTLQLDAIASGSRWDLIAVRRDWQPAAGGPSAFVKVTGSSTKALPAIGTAATAWNRRPGIVDDQPLALVQVTAGQTEPTGYVDLRAWAANGGVVIADKLALDYLAIPGARVILEGTEYRYVLDGTGGFAWVSDLSRPSARLGQPATEHGEIKSGVVLVSTDATGKAIVAFKEGFKTICLAATANATSQTTTPIVLNVDQDSFTYAKFNVEASYASTGNPVANGNFKLIYIATGY